MRFVWDRSTVGTTRGLVAMAVAVLLGAALLVAAPGRVDAAGADTVGRTAAKRAPDPAYVVAPGIVFNHPFRGTKKKTKIQRKIIKTVKNVPAGESIRLMTWNFDSPRLAKVFINAHKRGVSVQIIMSRGLAKGQGPGRSYPTLRKALAKGSPDRPKELRSWIRTCSSTCRGKGGAMHDKLMLVSRSGATSWIAMQGSGNFTGAAAVQQFNDWTTITENQPLYDGWMTMWKQAKKDKPAKVLRFTVPSTTTPGSTITSMFAPHKKKVDPALKVLNQVQCAGATNVPGGRTKVRIANAVWGDQRGVKVARKVRALANEGCDVRIVFMMMPLKIRNILRGLPAKQMVYITGATANKFKDRYVHLKGLSVQGNVAGRTDGNAVLSSSENWTKLGWHSDEQNVIFWDDAAMAEKYAGWVDLIYRQAPRSLNNYVPSADPNGRVVPGTEFLGPKDYPFEELELY
ncbi:phospholipase D-like domain-containing protein [Nocardioides sp. QY071]|uniref:phospholipase D-like domain-containing protein n=1 Tax=Nocardioides sp. QY071 TaxID=3044187 RepID=UPI00249BB70F|nr:phospholipase D-like domain-containing protein [Nocardioides sp. QY071]WGY04472.1 phospholipase D-like domain-containing protein [Nocardioides sp. QY071]